MCNNWKLLASFVAFCFLVFLSYFTLWPGLWILSPCLDVYWHFPLKNLINCKSSVKTTKSVHKQFERIPRYLQRMLKKKKTEKKKNNVQESLDSLNGFHKKVPQHLKSSRRSKEHIEETWHQFQVVENDKKLIELVSAGGPSLV